MSLVVGAVAAAQVRTRRYQEMLARTEASIEAEAGRVDATDDLELLQTLVLRRLTLRYILGYPDVCTPASD